MFGIGRLDPEWTLPSRLGDNPAAWVPADREERHVVAEMEEKPSLASVEGDLFGALFGFYQNVMALLRESSLNDTDLKLATEAIHRVLSNVNDEIKHTGSLNLKGSLERGYEEIRRLVEEMSSKTGDEKTGK